MGQFLEALAGYGHDVDGYYANAGEDVGALSPWTVFAELLMGARIYE